MNFNKLREIDENVHRGEEDVDQENIFNFLLRQACLNGYKVLYFNIMKLLEEIAIARVSSSLHGFFIKMAQTDLLIDVDFGVKVLDGQQLLDFVKIIEDRHGRKATCIISQLPVANWYDVLTGNTTAADAILDRNVHSGVRVELKGSSESVVCTSDDIKFSKALMVSLNLYIDLLLVESLILFHQFEERKVTNAIHFASYLTYALKYLSIVDKLHIALCIRVA